MSIDLRDGPGRRVFGGGPGSSDEGVRTVRRLESGGPTRPRDCSVSVRADALNLSSEGAGRFVAAVRA